MPKIYGPFRLIHLDGRVFHFDKVEEMATVVINDPYQIHPGYQKGDWRYGWERAMQGIGEIPFRRVTDSFVALTWERELNDHRWIVRDSSDLIVPLWWIKQALHDAGFKDRVEAPWIWHPRWYKLNWVPGAKGSRFRGYRRPANISQKKTREASEAHMREYDLRPPKRKFIPTNWDDIPRGSHRDRNWKRFRKKQYRN